MVEVMGRIEVVAQSCSVKKVFLEISQNSQENACARISFFKKLQSEACNFIKKETLTQSFSSKFCEISKNTFFYRTGSVAPSGRNWKDSLQLTLLSCESWMFVKEKPDRKKQRKIDLRLICHHVFHIQRNT